jgi:hypothetical protein
MRCALKAGVILVLLASATAMVVTPPSAIDMRQPASIPIEAGRG